MSAKLTPRNILGKPVTKKEFLDVLTIFEQNIDRKIWAATPLYVKLWRYFRGPHRAKRRQARLAKADAQRIAKAKQEAGGGVGVVQKGVV